MIDETILINNYLKQINANNNLSFNYIIFLIGLPGAGKSTIAKLLNKYLNIYIASNDEIRRYLDGKIDNKIISGKPDLEKQEMVIKIAKERTQFLFKNKINHIVDANCLKDYDYFVNMANKYNFSHVTLQIICDEKIILERIKRKLLNNNLLTNSSANIGTYYRAKSNCQKTPLPNDIFASIDTTHEGEIESQIINLVKEMSKIICL